MKTKLFLGFTLAAALLAGGPALAHDGRGGGGGGRGGGGSGVAAFHSGGSPSYTASRGGSGRATAYYSSGPARAYRGGTFATGRTFRSNPTVAFGGSSSFGNTRNFSTGRSGNSTFAFRSHTGWSHNREYAWHGQHYRWYNNAWFALDPFPYYADYGYPYYNSQPAYTVYGSDYDNSGSPSVDIQQELARDGYYRGPIDGIVGPGTRAAIAAYQRDNGLRVTGAINRGLLDSLGVE